MDSVFRLLSQEEIEKIQKKDINKFLIPVLFYYECIFARTSYDSFERYTNKIITYIQQHLNSVNEILLIAMYTLVLVHTHTTCFKIHLTYLTQTKLETKPIYKYHHLLERTDLLCYLRKKYNSTEDQFRDIMTYLCRSVSLYESVIRKYVNCNNKLLQIYTKTIMNMIFMMKKLDMDFIQTYKSLLKNSKEEHIITEITKVNFIFITANTYLSKRYKIHVDMMRYMEGKLREYFLSQHLKNLN